MHADWLEGGHDFTNQQQCPGLCSEDWDDWDVILVRVLVLVPGPRPSPAFPPKAPAQPKTRRKSGYALRILGTRMEFSYVLSLRILVLILPLRLSAHRLNSFVSIPAQQGFFPPET